MHRSSDHHHFLCCMPVRVGAIMITLVEIFLYLFAAAGSFILIAQPSYDVDNKGAAIAANVIMGLIYTFLFVLNIFGFAGACKRRISLIRPYVQISMWELGITSAASVIYCVVLIALPRNKYIKQCTAGLNPKTDQDTIDACHNYVAVSKIVLVIATVIVLLVHTYAVWIVSQYKGELEDSAAREYAYTSKLNESYASHDEVPPMSARV